MLRGGILLCFVLLAATASVAESVHEEERLIGWKGEVHRNNEGKLRGGGVPKVKTDGVVSSKPKRRRWVEQIALKPRYAPSAAPASFSSSSEA